MTQEKYVQGITMGFPDEMYEHLKEVVAKKYNLDENDSSMRYGRAIAKYIRTLIERERKKVASRKKSKKKKEVVIEAETIE